MSRREVLWHFRSCWVMNSMANPFPGISLIFSSSYHFPFQLFLHLYLSKRLNKPQRAIFSSWSYNTVGSIAQLWLAFHSIYLVTLREVPMTRDFPSPNPLPDLPYRLQSKTVRHLFHFRKTSKIQSRHRPRSQKLCMFDSLTPEYIFNRQELSKSLVLECDFLNPFSEPTVPYTCKTTPLYFKLCYRIPVWINIPCTTFFA